MSLATATALSGEALRLEGLLNAEQDEELRVPASWLEEDGSSYEPPEALADEVEELEERIVWFVVPVWLLLILGITLLAGAYYYCLRKGLRFYAMYRVNRKTVRVGCRK